MIHKWLTLQMWNHRYRKPTIKSCADFIFLKFYLFIYLWLCWSFTAARAFLQLQRSGAILCCGVHASHCGGFSWWGTWALGHAGFRSFGSQDLEHTLNS